MGCQCVEKKEKGEIMICDTCAFYTYDEEFEDYYCDMDMDEDDVARLMSSPNGECPYYRNGDEYETVRHQM